MQSLLANDLLMAADPVYMSQRAGIIPDPWQERLLSSPSNRILVNCSRQSGKSTTTGTLAMHTALYEKNATVLLLSPSLRQSGELFRKCASVYRALDRPVKPKSESALSLELKNGSRVISLPGKEGTIRGISKVTLLIIDEASRVPNVLYKSVRPMLAVSGGKLVLLSTPFTCRGFFYDAWLNKENWEYFEVPATECPRISPEFLAEEKASMGDFWFQQEYMCQFMDAEGSAFRAQDIERIVHDDVEAWNL
jgi:hypothetical protein